MLRGERKTGRHSPRYGIPAFKLPAAEIDWEVESITDMGVHIRLGMRWGRHPVIGKPTGPKRKKRTITNFTNMKSKNKTRRKQMIEITESAAEKLAAYLTENKIDSPVRIAAMNGCGGSCSSSCCG